MKSICIIVVCYGLVWQYGSMVGVKHYIEIFTVKRSVVYVMYFSWAISMAYQHPQQPPCVIRLLLSDCAVQFILAQCSAVQCTAECKKPRTGVKTRPGKIQFGRIVWMDGDCLSYFSFLLYQLLTFQIIHILSFIFKI